MKKFDKCPCGSETPFEECCGGMVAGVSDPGFCGSSFFCANGIGDPSYSIAFVPLCRADSPAVYPYR